MTLDWTKKIQTACGHPARLLAQIDSQYSDQTHVVAVSINGFETLHTYDAHGVASGGADNVHLALINVAEEVDVWINLYRLDGGGFRVKSFLSEDDAQLSAQEFPVSFVAGKRVTVVLGY